MEGSYRNVSRTEPCPICGKSDWCEIYSCSNPNGDEELNVCRRITGLCDIISSLNGKTYEFIKEFSDGAHLYQESEQRKYYKEIWLRDNRKVSARKKKEIATKHPTIIKKENDSLHCVPTLCNENLDTIYRSFLNKLTLNRKHYKYLQKEGWSHNLIRKACVKSMPTYDYKGGTYKKKTSRTDITQLLINEFGSVKGVPGFYLDTKGNWTFSGKTGLIIPILDFKGRIIRLRIRLDHPEVNEKGKENKKYVNFSSFYLKKENGTSYNAFKDGSRSGSHPGVYYNKDRDDFTVCYITEGEKKAIFSNEILRHPVISLPGVNTYNKLFERDEYGLSILDFMQSLGCKYFIVAYDADKIMNDAVLKCETKLVEKLVEHNFRPVIANWNPGFGKGIDDILKFNIRPNLISVRPL